MRRLCPVPWVSMQWYRKKTERLCQALPNHSCSGMRRQGRNRVGSAEQSVMISYASDGTKEHALDALHVYPLRQEADRRTQEGETSRSARGVLAPAGDAWLLEVESKFGIKGCVGDVLICIGPSTQTLISKGMWH